MYHRLACSQFLILSRTTFRIVKTDPMYSTVTDCENGNLKLVQESRNLYAFYQLYTNGVGSCLLPQGPSFVQLSIRSMVIVPFPNIPAKSFI